MARLTKTQDDTPAAQPATPPIFGMSEEDDTVQVEGDLRPFLLLWQRGDYVVLHDGKGGYAVGPRLIVQPLEGGSGGVIQRRDGQYNVAGLLEDAKAAKKVVLPQTLRYCVELAPGSKTYRPAWGRVEGAEVVQEQSAYLAWVLARIEDGTIPAPGLADLRACRAKLAHVLTLTRHERGHEDHTDPLARQVAAVDAAIAAVGGTP